MDRMPTPSLAIQDGWIDHPQGRLFVRTWRPEGALQPAQDERLPIVLLHDSLGCVALWRDFPAQLSLHTGRRVIAYDRLGFGRSDAHPGVAPSSFIEDEARTFFPAVRAQLGFDRFIALGHSVGGGMGVHIAARHAQACVGLITESAQAFVEDRTLQGILEAKANFQHADQFARLVKYHGDKAKWVLDAWTETWLNPAYAGWSLDAVLPQVRCPVLALHGEHDEFGSVRHPRQIAEMAAGAGQCEILDGIHHVPHKEAEPLVLARVGAFIDALTDGVL